MLSIQREIEKEVEIGSNQKGHDDLETEKYICRKETGITKRNELFGRDGSGRFWPEGILKLGIAGFFNTSYHRFETWSTYQAPTSSVIKLRL